MINENTDLFHFHIEFMTLYNPLLPIGPAQSSCPFFEVNQLKYFSPTLSTLRM